MLNLPKGMIYMALAVVAGLVAAFGIQRYVAHKTYIPPVATGKVVVSNADVSPGKALNGAAVRIVSWPKELIPPQAASGLNQVDGRVVQSPIAKGEPVLFSKLAPVGTSAGLSSMLDDNKRALTVRVDDVIGVAGFIHPRDKVDVLADLKMPGKDENFSKIILQNITVLSIGQSWDQRGDGKPLVVNTVTLELTPEQAEIMNLASNEGRIRLALRSRRNEKTVETAGVGISGLFSGVTAAKKVKEKEPEKEVVAEPVVQPPPQPVKEVRTVEIIKGLERSKSEL
jgi:pilus assembly protein CpaB